MAAAEAATPRLVTNLVIANISKRPNVRALICTALAMGVSTILVVGQPSLVLDADSPDNGLQPYLRHCLIPRPPKNDNDDMSQSPPRGRAFLIRFDKWAECVAFLQAREIPLVGVEIDAGAITIHQLLHKVQTSSSSCVSIALVMGNEGQGLSATQIKDCEELVRLPQYGAGTASYNVYVAASLVLQRLHQYQTRTTCATTNTSNNTSDN